jgi:hypothetical protein
MSFPSLLFFFQPTGGLAYRPVVLRMLITVHLLLGWTAQKRTRLVAEESASAPMPVV